MYNSDKAQDIRQRSFNFSIRIIKLVRVLPKDIAGYAISNQLIRSGTSVGANIEEAQNASTRKDFTHGLTIALKEARETEYWLKIITEIELIDKSKMDSILEEVLAIIKILTAIIKKTKLNSQS